MNRQLDLAWLAGIIDGEGSIFVMRQKRKDRERDTNYILRMSVQSTDPFMSPECKRIAGEGEAISVQRDARGYSNTLKWQVNGRKAIKVLKELLPYMRVKKEQAITAIHFQETTKKHWRHMTDIDYQHQQELYMKLKQQKLNLKLGSKTE